MLPNEILKGRVVRALQRWFAIQGEPPAPQLSPEVQAGFDVMNPSTDFFYLLGEKLGALYADITGDATHPPIAQLYNPAGSGVLVIVERIHVSTVVGVTIAIRDANSGTLATGSTVVARNRDARGFGSVPVSQGKNDTTVAASGAVLWLGDVPGASHIEVVFPYVLTPGTWLTVNLQTNATRLVVAFQFRERPLESLEQRLP